MSEKVTKCCDRCGVEIRKKDGYTVKVDNKTFTIGILSGDVCSLCLENLISRAHSQIVYHAGS